MKLIKDRGYFTKLMESEQDYIDEEKEFDEARKKTKKNLKNDKDYINFIKTVDKNILESHMQFYLGERMAYGSIKSDLLALKDKKGNIVYMSVGNEPFSYIRSAGIAQGNIDCVLEEIEKRENPKAD